MSENFLTSLSLADFKAEVERLLTPTYAECFSDETRKVRNFLLLTTFVLVLLVLGVVEVGNKSDLPLLPLSITVKAGMRWILMALCAYFLLLLATRSYTEWMLWRLRHQAPATSLLDLRDKVFSSWQVCSNEVNAILRSTRDGSESLAQLKLQRYKTSAETDEQDNHKIEVLERQLSELKDAYGTRAPELKLWEAKITYLHKNVFPIPTILKIRFWFEMLIPILFGVLAIVLGLVVRRSA